jgi:putative transposase
VPVPLRLLLATLAGWVNRRLRQVIGYLVEENRLPAKGHRLGRRILRRVATIVTPDTILRWYRHRIAQKWTSECQRPGRAPAS